MGIDLKNFDKREKAIIQDYLLNDKPKQKKKKVHTEGLYKIPNKNIIDYEKVVTVDEAIERAKINKKD